MRRLRGKESLAILRELARKADEGSLFFSPILALLPRRVDREGQQDRPDDHKALDGDSAPLV
jgi:hypothetical protein